ncbi:phage scaffolding protein [Agrilactobacillus yilanensis]|uniref:Phage scaffolding protein n=1 Tax=Agrilactobacillus yilanensis TaxID=2485997 RepID=A0ABW4J643_9LACO|nr:phage scaffolding protein [Agrilactobacillus yilanensis]
MKRDALKTLGLTDEQINAVIETNGHDIENAKATGASEVATLKQENESLKTQITDRDKDLKGLQKQLKYNDDVSQQLTDLQSKYDADTQSLTEQLNTTKLNGALNNALTAAKVRNTKAIKGLLDMDSIKLNDKGELVGVNDQLDLLKKSNAYLFDMGTTQSGYNPAAGKSTTNYSANLAAEME